MLSGSKSRSLFYLTSLTLLVILCIFFRLTAANSHLLITLRNVPPALAGCESTEKEFSREAQGAEPPLDEQLVGQVRGLLATIDYDEKVEKERRQLIEMGERVFPAYEAILADPKSNVHEIAGVFSLLRRVKADRRRFIPYAISRLRDAKVSVRSQAVILLGHIGSPAEASPVVALLSDKRKDVVYDAARTLAATGGPNEVVAMDVWLRGVSHRDDRQLREDVQKRRDELKKRLDAKKDSKK